eukprot:scaffold4882_cov70-Phaeocystis_antarctica.AAC.12
MSSHRPCPATLLAHVEVARRTAPPSRTPLDPTPAPAVAPQARRPFTAPRHSVTRFARRLAVPRHLLRDGCPPRHLLQHRVDAHAVVHPRVRLRVHPRKHLLPASLSSAHLLQHRLQRVLLRAPVSSALVRLRHWTRCLRRRRCPRLLSWQGRCLRRDRRPKHTCRTLVAFASPPATAACAAPSPSFAARAAPTTACAALTASLAACTVASLTPCAATAPASSSRRGLLRAPTVGSAQYVARGTPSAPSA